MNKIPLVCMCSRQTTTENWFIIGIVIIESSGSSTEESELDSVSYEVKPN